MQIIMKKYIYISPSPTPLSLPLGRFKSFFLSGVSFMYLSSNVDDDDGDIDG